MEVPRHFHVRKVMSRIRREAGLKLQNVCIGEFPGADNLVKCF